MLDLFAGRSLPGEDPWEPTAEAESTDVASFSELWITANMVESCCLMPKHQPGWASAGTWQSQNFLLQLSPHESVPLT